MNFFIFQQNRCIEEFNKIEGNFFFLMHSILRSLSLVGELINFLMLMY